MDRVQNSQARAIDMAIQLADRLIDEGGTFVTARQQMRSGPGLGGDAGIAIFMAAMSQVTSETKYESGLHAYMKAATRVIDPRARGMFAGLSGLLATCRYVMRVEPRYEGLLQRCARALADATPVYEPAASFREYDIVSGRAGEAISFAQAVGVESARVSCDYLAWLVQDYRRWRCPHPRVSDGGPVNDLGIAHGLAGILVALALSAPFEPKYDEALTAGFRYLCSQREQTGAMGWPGSVPPRGTNVRSAWCYGTPGCAMALLLGAKRLGMSELEAVARDALQSLMAQPIERWNMPDHALCHGHLGNALIFAVAAQETGDVDFLAVSNMLVDRALEGFCEESTWGYRAWAPQGFVDLSNLLEGTAGIGLALLTLAGACDSSWMSYFGLPTLRNTCRTAAKSPR
ncbi:MAG: lanthionine synthetase LanC family protein [Candidatus Aquilonibacter sp.]